MDDADAMRIRERVRHLRRALERLTELQRRALLPLLDVLPFEPLHGGVGVALFELAERDDADDVVVVEPREHAAFASEARLFARIDSGDRDDLQSDGCARHFIAG